jgi:hypothetical protein
VDVYIHVFFTSALLGGELSASRPCRFIPRERVPRTHWKGGWVGSRAGLDDVKKRKIFPYKNSNSDPLGRPPRNQSLYRLTYPESSDFNRGAMNPKGIAYSFVVKYISISVNGVSVCAQIA